jgi:hypothetical protein
MTPETLCKWSALTRKERHPDSSKHERYEKLVDRSLTVQYNVDEVVSIVLENPDCQGVKVGAGFALFPNLRRIREQAANEKPV